MTEILFPIAVAALLIGALLLGGALLAGFASRLRRLHAVLALGATALAVASLARADRPVSMITWDGAALAGVAAALGCAFWLRLIAPGPQRGMLIGLHALFGAAGALLLVAWLAG